MPLARLRASKLLALPSGWARNSINTSIYRGAGVLTVNGYQFGAYYTSPQGIMLFRRHLVDGALETSQLEIAATLKDAHNGISMGCDHEGYLHLSYNQHGSKLCYVHSLRPYEIGAWSKPTGMTGVWEDSVTYPYFLTRQSAEQPLLFLYRRGTAISGDVHIKMLEPRRRRWRDVPCPILAGSQLEPWQCGPYLNHPAVDQQGQLHLFFTWRTAPSGGELLVNNHNVDYARSTDWGMSWEASNGQALPLPITPVRTETIYGTPPGCGLMNQCGATVDSSGRPFVVFYMSGGTKTKFILMWHDGAAWAQRTLSDVHEGFTLKGRGTLRLPISRPDVVIDRSDRVWLVYRDGALRNRMAAIRLDPPDYLAATARKFLLWSRDIGHCEPVVDRGRLAQDGVLSMFLQRTEQGDREGEVASCPSNSPTFVADWHLNDDPPAVESREPQGDAP